MASGKATWKPRRKERNAGNWAIARKREAQAVSNGHPGVSARAHNGKTQLGYTPGKILIRAAKRAGIQ